MCSQDKKGSFEISGGVSILSKNLATLKINKLISLTSLGYVLNAFSLALNDYLR